MRDTVIAAERSDFSVFFNRNAPPSRANTIITMNRHTNELAKAASDAKSIKSEKAIAPPERKAIRLRSSFLNRITAS